ncbi:MAG: hypothetical protein RLZZ546_3119 [Bacteroidota bacterium]
MCVAISYVSGQAGMTVYAGPSVAFSSDKIVTPSGAHYGYVIGANARLNSDGMYFLLSGEYGRYDFLSNNKLSFIGGDDLGYMKGKIGIGFDFLKLSRNMFLRSKIQGTVLFVNSYNEELLSTPLLKTNGYTAINDGVGGLATSLGISKGIFSLDLEYDHGLFNIFKEKKSSKMNFLNLVFGVRF